MTSADAAISVTVAPRWANGLLLRPATRPVVPIAGHGLTNDSGLGFTQVDRA